MKKDTVLLALENYNELRDYKKEVEKSREESKFAVIEERWTDMFTSGYTCKYYTDNEAVLDFEKRNKELTDENKELKAKINDLKKMPYWEFRKWRKSSKIYK